MEIAVYFATTLGLGTIAASFGLWLLSRVLHEVGRLRDKIDSFVTKETCMAHRSLMTQTFNHHDHEDGQLVIKRMPMNGVIEVTPTDEP